VTSRSGLFAILLFLSGCVTKPVVVQAPTPPKPKIRRIAVAPIKGNAGPQISNELVRQLVAAGVHVSEKAESADAVLTASIIDYRPASKTLVFLGEMSSVTPGGQAQTISNPVVSFTNSQALTEGPALSLKNTQIVSVSATVGVSARLVESSTGNPVWADESTYEALDVAGALQAVASNLTKSLERAVPGLTAARNP
jgi:hypothetical protein